MTKICGDASTFAASALRGFSLLHPDLVRYVRGGVLRATPGRRGKVAVVLGGGSGHYPAFAGYVGPGFGDAAVAGDIFASPSTQAIKSIARQADLDGGIILGYGNYAGDVLNFGIAADRLREEGYDVRVLATADDVASSDASTREKRRGIAGDLVIFRIVGAAAEAGLTLDEVEEVAQRVNRQTCTFGVAFDGCTLPGEKEKLFEVPKNRMALGLGVHGEPGIDEQDVPDPEHLAQILFDRLLAELPEGASRRVAVLLNGLGSTKQEELFVLWDRLVPMFEKAGLTLVAPLVGEYVTSLDMAGCSLTLTWLDEDLERYWRSPVESAALSHGQLSGDGITRLEVPEETEILYMRSGTAQGRRGGTCVAAVMDHLARTLAEAESDLGHIDAVVGDGDHGQGMARGSAAAAKVARAAADAGAGPATVLASAADAWADRAGGTSGALWGEGLRAFSLAFDDNSLPDAQQLSGGARNSMERIMELGRAKPGDKTLVDALVPFVETLEKALAAGHGLVEAWQMGAQASHEAAQATRDLLPRMGRAKMHGERSKGHPDAGALSLALCARIVGEDLGRGLASPGGEGDQTEAVRLVKAGR
ncbi:dihydroxyacetone kinase family protein [Gluconobacter oxydans]|uniref:Dihydroxyacetone kinase n=2 Tax=Gluconobacter oxydans TaxID=442 RepID=Q5FNU0_GLUOX|nr:dihydroxyacetone kinase family protein [Gluconobacter oxydans]AAW61957.1 Dihydroxyacetone kinase [Gluconobacter oxydans 621H]KXV34341.1 dihydroxyacetone kinase [Gluconobacter oxydans]MBF0857314.1 dihydroxyacetone kinase family protein [Gluconobacter oxydans]TCW21971.1 homodimeric dihydroxyacetone kinase [Gluconobacter oxydans]GEC61856.1 erythrulose kinase [Gluconobacter oxydans]